MAFAVGRRREVVVFSQTVLKKIHYRACPEKKIALVEKNKSKNFCIG
jgi:hypothetical protein